MSETEQFRVCTAVGAAVLVVFWWFEWPGGLPLGAGFFIAILTVAPLRRWVSSVWMKGVHALGTVNTTVILTAVFYLVLTPLAWVTRRIRGSSLELEPDPDEASYLRVRTRRVEPADFTKTW